VKEDILEQIVDDYLQFNGYFTTHNVRFKPDLRIATTSPTSIASRPMSMSLRFTLPTAGPSESSS